MDNNQPVDVATVLSTVARQLDLNQDHLNNVDNAGTHGRRVAAAFNAGAQAALNAGTDDAGKQLQAAAQAMRSQGQGKSIAFYAQGLEQAAQKFQGQAGISQASLGTFLQSFLGGVQQNNPAQPGQGTMLDSLGPAVNAFLQGQQNGNTQQGIANALGAAINGTAGTGTNGVVDPGAASASNVLGGIFAAVAPGIMNMIMGGGQQSSGQGFGSSGTGGMDLGGLLGGLLGGGASSGQQSQVGGTMGWLTGLLGGMASNTGATGQAGGGVDLGGLLGGLMGGGSGQQTQGGTSTSDGGVDLGGLLGGLMGNQGGAQSQGGNAGGFDLNSLLGDLNQSGNNENQ